MTTNPATVNTRITISTFVALPIAQVWSTWTGAAHITQWCAASDH